MGEGFCVGYGKEKEPVKVNAYYGICEFAVGKDTWHVLSDDSTLILARDTVVLCMDKAKQLYSLKYDKTRSFTTTTGRSLQLIIVTKNRVSVIREGGLVDDSNKKNVAKI